MCIEVFNVQGFLDAIDKKLSKLELIYADLSSGRAIEYVGHSVTSDSIISGEWLKDEIYKDEEEFRFSFIPIIKQDGDILQPDIRLQNGQRLIKFYDAKNIAINLKPTTIICKEAIKFCRWR